MITLRPSLEEELERFVAFESEDDTREFIIPYSLFQHRKCFHEKGIEYLSIVQEGELVGFFLLHVTDDAVEFRRVVTSRSARGAGQDAIRAMHAYCLREFGVKRIWLDVFAKNERGRHIYSKLGYVETGCSDYL